MLVVVTVFIERMLALQLAAASSAADALPRLVQLPAASSAAAGALLRLLQLVVAASSATSAARLSMFSTCNASFESDMI